MVDGIHFLGIRHHGPGSAKNVRAYLEELEPDVILLEGPPEAEPLLPGVLHEQMKPPVALLAYQPGRASKGRVLSFCRVLTRMAGHVLCHEKGGVITFF